MIFFSFNADRKGHNGKFPCGNCWIYKLDLFEGGLNSSNVYLNFRHREQADMNLSFKILLELHDEYPEFNVKKMLTTMGMKGKVLKKKRIRSLSL